MYFTANNFTGTIYTHLFTFIGVYNLKTVECYLYATIKLGVGSVQMS